MYDAGRMRLLGGDATAEQDSGHTPPKLGGVVGRCEQIVSGSEDAGDDDLDLEICFAEEMDAMESSNTDTNGDSESDDYIGKGMDQDSHGATSSHINEWQDVHATGCHKNYTHDARDTPEWLQFINSTGGVLRYMEEAAVAILGASSLQVPCQHQDHILSLNNTASDAEKEQVLTFHSSKRVLFPSSTNGTPSESTTLLPAMPIDLLRVDVGADGSLTPKTTTPDSDSNPEQYEPEMVELLVPQGQIPWELSADTLRSTGCLTTVARHPDTADVDVLTAEERVTTGSDRDIIRGGLLPSSAFLVEKTPAESSEPRAGRPATQAGPEPDSGQLAPAMGNKSDTPPGSVPAAGLPTLTVAQESVFGHRSAQNALLPCVGTTGSEPELPCDEWSSEANHIFTHHKEADVPAQLKKDSACIKGGMSVIADTVFGTDVIASVGEAEVARRIEREKARSIEARQKRREDNIRKARHARSMVVFQAVWRGRCTRTLLAPALASCRRESEETRRMFQEERLAESVAALEAHRRELETKRQLKELSAMRCAETTTRASWEFARNLEIAARGEELVRMRAEERFTRALRELKLQDLRQAERDKRETEEAAKMQSEDLAMRELELSEKAQILERAVMDAEDVLAKTLESIEEHELASSRAERCRMAVEDSASSVWKAEFHRQRELRLRQARARSTPIQRAMDPTGVAAARALVCMDEIRARSKAEPSTLLDERVMILERARRRENCKGHLDRISASALEVRSERQPAPTKRLEETLSGYGNKSHARGGLQGEESSGEGQVSPRKDRAGPAERDGTECKLTLDMLSHLGPLQDLTELELCVEGLTSASLLQACTSLKSLSLNVNRLSSPAGLVVSTSIVRLGLRDNRLTSLQGLSGFLSLRELRLDINHLASLHELIFLPALIELSANTNHIRELPDGFAAGLMSPVTPLPDRAKTASTLVERAVACGGLQKLELYHNRIASIHRRALQGLASLTHLDLGRNQLRTLDGHGLEACPALSTLILSQNLLREPPFPLCLPLLSELWLSGNQINSMGSWASPPPDVSMHPSPERSSERWILMEMSKDLTQELNAPPGHQDAKRNPLFRGRVMKPGQDGTSTYGEEGRKDGDSFVWLPTLEVLHLQDNMLETLGGCFSFTGCPLLRSFDASFNQLGTPDEIALSLQACRELEEVRLHDNPASACPNYVDAIALGCPHLSRMDGVELDSQVHWRAGANTYGGRADLVLPFLLNHHEDDANEARYGVATAAPSVPPEPTLIDVSKSEASSEDGVGEACPWCGVGTPSNYYADDTVSGTKGGGQSAGGRDETRGEGGKDPTSGVTNMPLYCAGIGRSPRRRKCASCGFAFPDAGLWSVPESRAARLSVKWEDILSAGDRWREGLCATPSVHDTIQIIQEDVGVDDTFRQVSLRGRDESASMRRRHRREERDLAASADLNGAEPRSLKGGGNSTSRLATMASSNRRLEIELELREHHAVERRHQAAKQLCYHSTGVDRGYVGVHDRTWVVLGDRSTPTEGEQYADSCFHPDTLKNDRIHQTRAANRQRRAARAIQRLWHRRQERAALPKESPLRRGQHVSNTWSASEKAVMKLQSAFRGFHVRRALQAALDSARYVDDELEGLLNVNGGARFELDRFLSPPPELGDGWWRTAAPQDDNNAPCPRHPTPPCRAKSTSDCFIDTARAVVRNTPLRPKAEGADDVEASSEAALGSFDVGSAPQSDNVKFRSEGPQAANIFIGRRVKDREAETTSTVGILGGDDSASTRDEVSGGGGGPQREVGNSLARAWGLKDPRVARSIVKRANRLRKLQNGEARREKLKDPDVRFNAFATKAGEHRSSQSHCSRSAGRGESVIHRSKGSDGGCRRESRVSRAAFLRLAPIMRCDGDVATTDPGAPPSTSTSTRRGAPRNALPAHLVFYPGKT